MKKRILSLLLALALALTLLPAGAFGAEPRTSGTDAYSNNTGVGAQGETSDRIQWTVYQDGTLYLKPTLNRESVLVQGDDAWATVQVEVFPVGDTPGHWETGKDFIKHLVVDDGIANIVSYMFYSYWALETVTLLGGMRTIEPYAFASCACLTTVTFGGYVGTIEERAFAGCDALSSFTSSASIGSLGTDVFGCIGNAYCVSLTAFDIPVDGDIGVGAFGGCSALRRMSPIRGNIGAGAFLNTALEGKDILIVSGHTGTIGRNALPDSPRYMGTQAEFEAAYSCATVIRPVCQYLGPNVRWTLNNGVLRIMGSGETVDLYDINEQPWVNLPGNGIPDDQRDAITAVILDADVVPGAHVLELLDNRVTIRYIASVENGSGSGKYAAGTNVTIRANGAPKGKRFAGWTGLDGLTLTAGSAETQSVTFTMPAQNVSVAAVYIVPETYQITALVNLPEAGWIKDMFETETFDGTQGLYAPRAHVLLQAFPNEGYEFVNWTENGRVVETKRMIAFQADSDRTLVANFRAIVPVPTHSISVLVEGEGTAYAADASGDPVSWGEEWEFYSLIAEPAESWYFVGWEFVSGNVWVEDLSNPHTDMRLKDEDVVIRAVFEEYDPLGYEVFKTFSLTLGDSLGLNFFLDLSLLDVEDPGGSCVEFYVGKIKTPLIVDYDENFTNETGQYYGFTCPLNVLQMADTIRAVYRYTQDGAEQSVYRLYSVKQYLRAFSELEDQFDPETVALVHAIADYGHYTQAYLAEVHGFSIEGEDPDYKKMDYFFTDYDRIMHENSGFEGGNNYDYFREQILISNLEFLKSFTRISWIDKVTYTLDCKSRTELTVYLRWKDLTEEGYTVHMADASVEFNGETYSFVPDGDRYRLTVPIPAHLLSQKLYINGETWVTGEAYTSLHRKFIIHVSPLSYVLAVLDNGDLGRYSAAKFSMVSIYYYSKAADDYISAHTAEEPEEDGENP